MSRSTKATNAPSRCAAHFDSRSRAAPRERRGRADPPRFLSDMVPSSARPLHVRRSPFTLKPCRLTGTLPGTYVLYVEGLVRCECGKRVVTANVRFACTEPVRAVWVALGALGVVAFVLAQAASGLHRTRGARVGRQAATAAWRAFVRDGEIALCRIRTDYVWILETDARGGPAQFCCRRGGQGQQLRLTAVELRVIREHHIGAGFLRNATEALG
jgi:hypothetical protein